MINAIVLEKTLFWWKKSILFKNVILVKNVILARVTEGEVILAKNTILTRNEHYLSQIVGE